MGDRERKRRKRIREYVVYRDGAICCYCDMPLSDDLITLDHIVCDSRRGTFNSTNLTISCGPCNNRRGNQLFFEYCKQFNWPQDKINHYKILYYNNLKIKILNISKEECLKTEYAIPLDLIQQACDILGLKGMDFSDYEKAYFFNIKFGEVASSSEIKYNFGQLIRIIEMDA